jgi:Leucine-rich repeat (LRR) protein
MKQIYKLTIVLALGFLSLGISAQTLEKDSLALVDFYNAAGGASWTNQGNWLTGPITTWEFIKVDTLDIDGDIDSVRVTELAVSMNNMSGTISPSIGNLTELTLLEIKGVEGSKEYVDISGSIPAELWNCTKINRLQIKFTKITGNIPDGIEKMDSLSEINFQGTKLACELPEELFELPSLSKAYLHQSDFKGTVPSTVVGKDNLKRLYLQDNKLEGPLPFANIHNADAKIQLTGNYFTIEDVLPYHDSVANIKQLTNDYQFAQDTMFYTDENTKKGDKIVFNFTAPGAETYAWLKEGEDTPLSTTDTAYTIESVQLADTGVYSCHVQTSKIANFEVLAIFVIESVDTTTQTSSIFEAQEIFVNVYPNPCNEVITIESDSYIESVKIIDVTGKVVLSISSIDKQKEIVSLNSLSSGVYFLSVTSADAKSIKKFLKK